MYSSPVKPTINIRVTEYTVSPQKLPRRCGTPVRQLNFEKSANVEVQIAQIPFGSMFNNELFSDVIFRFKESKTKLYGHRMALAAQSQVFSAMFQSGVLDASIAGRDIEIEYSEFEEDVFTIMLLYMYTGRVCCNTEQLIPLLLMGDKYEVVQLKEGLSKYMASHMNSENCLDVFLATSAVAETSQLREDAAKVIASQFEKAVLENKAFLQLDRNTVVHLLQRDDLFIDGEHVVLRAVVQWIQAAPNERMSELEELCSLIRWDYVQIDVLASILNTHDWLREHKKTLQLINDSLLNRCAKLAAVDIGSLAREIRAPRRYATTTSNLQAS